MGMEEKHGRAAYMEEGQKMTTADGQEIATQGDEVARVDTLLLKRRGGSNHD